MNLILNKVIFAVSITSLLFFFSTAAALAQDSYGESGSSGKGSSAAIGNATTNFYYDDLGRLWKVEEPATSFGPKETIFLYDAAGNRTHLIVPTVVSMTSATANEGETMMVAINRNGDVSGATTVDYYLEGETATSGFDFINASGTINFAAGETQQMISIITVADATPEPQESLFVKFSGMNGGVSWGDEVRVYINDAPAP